MGEAADKHYTFMYKGVRVDPYRIFEIYGICNAPQQHAIKKLLRAGKSVKSLLQDIDEAIMTLNRWKEMIAEDESMLVPKDAPGFLGPARGGLITMFPPTLGDRMRVGPCTNDQFFGDEAPMINDTLYRGEAPKAC